MKKLILTASLMLTVIAAFGQGEVVMNNSAATAILDSRYGTNWAVAAGNTVALYGATGAGQTASSLSLQPTAVTNLFLPGRFIGGTRVLTLPTGPATLQVRAWSGAYPTYEAAEIAAMGGTPNVVLGRSGLLTATLTTGATPPPTLLGSGLTTFGVTPVPEPSSIALGLLGLGAIVLFRRRK